MFPIKFYEVYHQKEQSVGWGLDAAQFRNKPELFERVARYGLGENTVNGTETKDLEIGFAWTQNDRWHELAEEYHRDGLFSWSFVPKEYFNGSDAPLLECLVDGPLRSTMTGDVIVCPLEEAAWEVSWVGFKRLV